MLLSQARDNYLSQALGCQNINKGMIAIVPYQSQSHKYQLIYDRNRTFIIDEESFSLFMHTTIIRKCTLCVIVLPPPRSVVINTFNRVQTRDGYRHYWIL